MKFFQKTSVAVIFTVLMIAAALFIGLSPALKSEPVPEPMAQTTAQEQTASQTPAAEQTSNTAGDEQVYPRRRRAVYPQRRKCDSGLQHKDL